MKKFTRRSYNRKLIVFALSMFMAVSLISVGFAAWVMSAVTNARADDVPVKVAVLSDASMEVTLDDWDGTTWSGDVICFDAEAGDNAGRMQASNDSAPVMSMVISGKVSHAEMLQDLTMKITLPSGLADVLESENDYVNFKGDWTEDQVVYDDATNTITVKMSMLNVSEAAAGDDGIQYKTFSFTLEFVWGTYFGEENPSVFYDDAGLVAASGRCDVVKATGEPAGTDETDDYISDDLMKTEMQDFHTMLVGGLRAPEDLTTGAYSGSIAIVVEASATAAD